MQKRNTFTLAASALAVIALAAVACATPAPILPVPPTPTPTASPTPSPTPTPAPTPTASPTPSPTPTPAPTATPTPAPTATPTPPPTLEEVIDIAAAALVRMASGDRRWSGVMFDSDGRILTTSRNLGQAPMAEYTTADGRTGQAWVVGRNDSLDVALLVALSTVGGFASIPIGPGGGLTVDDPILVLGYPQLLNAPLDRRQARVLGVLPDLNSGARYVLVQVAEVAGTEGGGIFNTSGQLAGLRMTQEQMIRLGLWRGGEVYALASESLGGFILRQLEGGISTIDESALASNEHAFPGLPAVYSGTVREGGSLVPAGSSARVYARVIKPGQPDAWYASDVFAGGLYQISISAGEKYANATVEFWRDRTKASEIRDYSPVFADIKVDLNF